MAEGESSDDSQKTEDPTPRRLEEARKRGQVAISREVNNWVMLLAATILIATASPSLLAHLHNHLRFFIENAHALPGPPGGFTVVLGQSFFKVLGMLALPLLVLLAAAFLGPFTQAGPIFATEIIVPDPAKISPMAGLKRLFSLRALAEFVKGIAKISVISLVGFILLKPYFATVDHMVGMPMEALLLETKAMVIRLMIGVLIVLAVIAVADVLYQRAEFLKRMRMTKQEMKEEYKQTEGDPHIKARLRQLRTERARQRMMQAVPKADVIITNPTHFSIALQYKPEEMEAPLCIAKGVDALALRIREVAKEHDIMIVENPPLARILYDTVDIDETIPPEHYKAVAEVISYVFRMKGKLK